MNSWLSIHELVFFSQKQPIMNTKKRYVNEKHKKKEYRDVRVVEDLLPSPKQVIKCFERILISLLQFLFYFFKKKTLKK